MSTAATCFHVLIYVEMNKSSVFIELLNNVSCYFKVGTRKQGSFRDIGQLRHRPLRQFLKR